MNFANNTQECDTNELEINEIGGTSEIIEICANHCQSMQISDSMISEL